MLKRRQIGWFAGAVTLATVGCTTLNQITTSQLQQDVNLLTASAQAILGLLPPNVVSPATLSQAQAIITAIQADAAQIAQAISTATQPSTSLLTSVSTLVNQLAALLAPYFPQAAAVAAAIQALLVLVGAIQSQVSGTPVPSGSISVSTARQVLTDAVANAKTP
jgi:hypothetical protein